ncbi:unnamed protein product, partial [Protopolystoma xenopodis]
VLSAAPGPTVRDCSLDDPSGPATCGSWQEAVSLEAFLSRDEEDGQTVVLVAVNGWLVGMLSVADPVKPEAALAVSALRARGVRVGLLTGDNYRTATAIARQVRQLL